MKNAIIAGLIIVGFVAFGIFAWNYPQKEPLEFIADLEEVVPEAEQPLPPLTLATTTIDGETYRVAEPFRLSVAAEDIGKARFMAMSPDGRMFVPDLVDYELSHEGKLYILEDFNEETHRFETKDTYLEGLRGPNSVAFYTDKNGRTWLYLALTAHLVRYPYEAGDTEPSGDGEIVIEFPNTQAPEAKSVVWHITRTISFYNDKLYISIGSGCNACEQPEGEIRGMVAVMNPDGSDVEIYANGLRNAVGLEWADDTLYLTENGVDHLGPGAPDELMYRVEQGTHYGWPYCYELDGERILDTATAWKNPVDCQDVPTSLTAFDPHAAPLGLAYFDGFHQMLNHSFLVSLHGSFEPGIQNGYQIVRVSKDGEQELFMDGFQDESARRLARPVDILQRDEDSFFFTDDFGGRVFYVYAD